MAGCGGFSIAAVSARMEFLYSAGNQLAFFVKISDISNCNANPKFFSPL
jgi:hypothetical protein